MELQQNHISMQMNTTTQLIELETCLNSLLSRDTAVFTPALRALFSFDQPTKDKAKKEKKKKSNKGTFTTLYGGAPSEQNQHQ